MANDKTNPPTGHLNITKSDTETYEGVAGIYVGTTGDVTCINGGVSAVYNNVPVGLIIPGQFTKIMSTGTTASDIVIMYGDR